MIRERNPKRKAVFSMFDRANIKQYAKYRLRVKHFTVVLILLITFLLGGSLATGTTASLNFSVSSPLTGWSDSEAQADTPIWDESGQIAPGHRQDSNDFFAQFKGALEDVLDELDAMLLILLPVLIILVMLVIAVAVALVVFLGNVMTVGAAGWLLRYLRGELPPVSELFACFRIYKPSVKAMLVRDVYTMLWSLLFFIPGIIKGYAYSMVPYIIYENPNLTPNQAIRLSCKLTDGYKWDLFVLDLSFIGWHLLSALTGGVVGILYVYPYIGATHAVVYDHLKQSALMGGRVSYDDFDQVAMSL